MMCLAMLDTVMAHGVVYLDVMLRASVQESFHPNSDIDGCTTRE